MTTELKETQFEASLLELLKKHKHTLLVSLIPKDWRDPCSNKEKEYRTQVTIQDREKVIFTIVEIDGIEVWEKVILEVEPAIQKVENLLAHRASSPAIFERLLHYTKYKSIYL